MQIEPFVMERWQSTYEHHVEINLSDSGVSPLRVGELLEGDDDSELLSHRLIYTQSNGTQELRNLIAGMYPGATPEHIEVTNGGAEANLISAWTLIKPGDEVILQLPNYMQLWGVLRSLEANVKPWSLQPDLDGDCWHANLEKLESMVTPDTKLIALCNPNNPAGTILGEEELDRIAALAQRNGAWILVDEIYHGAELDGTTTPSMWERHDRVIITNSLSKAYGLPGLRLGWLAGPPEFTADCWSRHDYTTIGPGSLSNDLAIKALQEPTRSRILQRTSNLLKGNLQIALDWVDGIDSLRTIRPRGGAYLMLAYDHDINSCDLAERLRVEKSVLVVPGEHFGMDGWLRVGFGEDTDLLLRGLERMHELLQEM
jgi:aspartate/methionine/tyrosine aminotransferase